MLMSKNIVITISREFGSGGRYIGEMVAKDLNIPFYDKAIIEMASDKTGFSPEYIKENEQKLTGASLFNFAITGSYAGNMVFGNGESLQDTMFFAQSNVIKEVASKHSCVIVGRCANHILEGMDNCINIFIYSDMENKIKRAVEEYKLDSANIEKILKERDKLRAKHYNYYTGKNWGDARNYHACLNSDFIGIDNTIELIEKIAKSKL
ncbi:putative cytidylate kinase [Brachyspira hyodysenteriae WA1]|uniref:Cytidylate kinase n=2 Tax=Brachyspira hyodysenteriae TaxID=159 RepID=A0A3B6V9Z1_BRAHW|nr:putative cytidylate kinase [Brachyspira hyodysenteriae WA1]